MRRSNGLFCQAWRLRWISVWCWVRGVLMRYPRPSMSSVSLFCFSPYDSFPLQLGFLEVQQQRHFQACYIQVTEHLRDMGIVECGNDFRIHDDTTVNDYVGNELADQVTAVENRILPLLVNSVCPFLKFDDQCVLVELFVQTRFEFI